MHCFLFDTCFVLTRCTIKSRVRIYNLAYPVIQREEIVVDTHCDLGGSGFKITDRTLTTNGEHEKRHWIDAFEKVDRLSRIALSKRKSSETVIETENDRVI